MSASAAMSTETPKLINQVIISAAGLSLSLRPALQQEQRQETVQPAERPKQKLSQSSDTTIKQQSLILPAPKRAIRSTDVHAAATITRTPIPRQQAISSAAGQRPNRRPVQQTEQKQRNVKSAERPKQPPSQNSVTTTKHLSSIRPAPKRAIPFTDAHAAVTIIRTPIPKQQVISSATGQ